MSDTADRVQKIVVEHLGVEADKVTQEASFIDDLGADSLDIVELVMAFEEEFGVEIPDDAAEKITTVGDATKYIASTRAKPSAAFMPAECGFGQARPGNWAGPVVFLRRIACVVWS